MHRAGFGWFGPDKSARTKQLVIETFRRQQVFPWHFLVFSPPKFVAFLPVPQFQLAIWCLFLLPRNSETRQTLVKVSVAVGFSVQQGSFPKSLLVGAMALSDLEHLRVLLKEETQQLRQELRRDISEIRQNEQIEQPTLERLLSGNMGQVGQMPPELIRWGEGFGGSGVLLGLLWIVFLALRWSLFFWTTDVFFFFTIFFPYLFSWWDAGPSAPHCFPDLGLGMSRMEITHRKGQAIRSTMTSCSNGIGTHGKSSRGAAAVLPTTAFGAAGPRANMGIPPTGNALATVCSLHRKCLRMELQYFV